MGRYPFCNAAGLKRGPWTPEEDQKLISCIQEYGPGRWRLLPEKAGLKRCGKSCRLRWTNYLSPDIKRGDFSLWEEHIIIQLHALLGNRWSAIARHLPKRTDNEIKNYWNTRLKKRLAMVPAATHKPKSPTLGQPAANGDSKNLTHMTQWEATRLEAERRMVIELKLHQHQRATSDSAQAQPINYKMATTSKLSLLENALMDMPAATDFTEGFGENYVDARAMHYYQEDKVFDTEDAWNILEPSDTNEGNSEDLLNHFLLNDSYGGEEGNTSYWNDLINLANFGPSDPAFFI